MQDGTAMMDYIGQIFNHRKTVLDDGLEVYVIEMVWTPDTNWCDEEDFTMEQSIRKNYSYYYGKEATGYEQ